MRIEFTCNGRKTAVEARPDMRALDLLRDLLGLTGTKEGCGRGECGACTILLDGEPVNACLVLALETAGRAVTTIEGVAEGARLHPVQQAFLDAGAVQCGFCTPGMVLVAKSLLERSPRPSEPEVRRAISGNLCRCTGYQKIVEAVLLAAERMSAGQPGGQP